MTMWGFARAALAVSALAVAAGCVGEAEPQPVPVVSDVIQQDRAAVVAELTALSEAPPVSRSEEAGVTVIRGTNPPPQLVAMASTLPVLDPLQAEQVAAEPDIAPGPATGGSLVAAAFGGGRQLAGRAAPGALASAEQLAALASPEQLAGLTRGPDAALAEMTPAAGPAMPTGVADDDPVVAEIRQRASMAPTSIQQLEARGAVRMTTDEISALTVGNTLTHTNADNGFSIATYYDPSGESRLINDGRGLPARYQISDGARCRIDSQGLGVCALLYRDGDTTWVCDQRDQGVCNWYVSQVQPGFVRG
ncbi:MAG: hypothetical protein R3F55_24760 [Alphaproteobacteria bacterium]